jgi:uncharacterized protein (DUF3084 family)
MSKDVRVPLTESQKAGIKTGAGKTTVDNGTNVGLEVPGRAGIEQTDMSIAQTDMAIEQTDMSINQTDMAIEQTDMSINQTDMAIEQTDMSINQTDMSIEQTDMSNSGDDV